MCCKLWLTYIMGTCIFCLGLLAFFNQSLSLLTILPLPITILTDSIIICVLHIRGFPGCSVVKNLSVKQEMGFDPWVGKILWRRKCNSLQYSCLENPIDREACGLQSKGSQRVRQDFMTKLPLTIRCKYSAYFKTIFTLWTWTKSASLSSFWWLLFRSSVVSSSCSTPGFPILHYFCFFIISSFWK